MKHPMIQIIFAIVLNSEFMAARNIAINPAQEITSPKIMKRMAIVMPSPARNERIKVAMAIL